jgi:hypothetical protein
MSAFETATRFFHACESLKGWHVCKDYVAPSAVFEAQCEPLEEVKSVQQYCEWMADLGWDPLAGCSHRLHSCDYDEAKRVAIFFATFTGTRVGDAGSVPPTNRQTTDYVYLLTMNADDKIEKMYKACFSRAVRRCRACPKANAPQAFPAPAG